MAKNRRLDRETVVLTAAELADKLGSVHDVTLTKLAAVLEIRVPSLYNHINGLDDLHDALAVTAMRLLLEELRAVVAGEVGVQALWRASTAYRRFARNYPGIYPLTLRAPTPDNEELSALAQELLQLLLLIFASCGLQGEDALHAVRGLRALLHGFISLEAAEGFKLSLDLDKSFHRAFTAYLLGVAGGGKK